jgi:hypothetical protein
VGCGIITGKRRLQTHALANPLTWAVTRDTDTTVSSTNPNIALRMVWESGDGTQQVALGTNGNVCVAGGTV